jgi:glycosyltransferase involved in cell wall biosynthesis
MRILIVTPYYPPYLRFGGPAFQIPEMVSELTERGHAITVFTPLYPEEEKEPEGENVFQGREDRIYLPVLWRYRSVTVHGKGISLLLKRVPSSDLIHIFGLYNFLGPAVAFFARRHKVPYIVEPMGMIKPVVRKIFLKKVFRKVVERPMLKKADLFIATSFMEKEEMVSEGIPEEKIVVRTIGVPVHPLSSLPSREEFREEYRIPPETFLLLYLGRISWKKGLDLLLLAYDRLLREISSRKMEKKESSPPVLLVIAGSDDGDGCYPFLREEAERFGLTGNLLFLPFLSGRKKLSALTGADLFVLPSLHENFAIVGAEAMACGTPLLVTSRCGISEFVKEHNAGWVIPWEEGEGKEEKIHRLFTFLLTLFQNREELKNKRERILKIRHLLSWSSVVDLQEEIYRRIQRRS